MDADLGPIAAYPSPPNNRSSPPDNHRDNTTPSSTLSPYERVTMASSMSPNQSSQSSFGGGPASHDKSPLSSLNLNFLKNLAEKRTTRGMIGHFSDRRNFDSYVVLAFDMSVSTSLTVLIKQMANHQNDEDQSRIASRL